MNEFRPPTTFEQKVYDALHLIPKGKVTTYRALGEYISCRSAQAIGQALRRNPMASGAPCHRVVKTDRTIGGFSGQSDGEPVMRKKRLLESEGISFQEDGTIPEEQCYFFDD